MTGTVVGGNKTMAVVLRSRGMPLSWHISAPKLTKTTSNSRCLIAVRKCRIDAYSTNVGPRGTSRAQSEVSNIQSHLNRDDHQSSNSLLQESVVSTTQKRSSLPNKRTEKSEEPRLPRSVQAAYLRPLRRHAKYGVPSCDLQLRSYSVRNLEFFADFALRAAYFLHLPASGPIPLPRLTERWTMPRSNFVHKKSQENFERITLRRLIQIQDGHPDTVKIWLAFLRKHAYYGVGMKANIWEMERLGVAANMDLTLNESKSILDAAWAQFGQNERAETSESLVDVLDSEILQRLDDGPLMST